MVDAVLVDVIEPRLLNDILAHILYQHLMADADIAVERFGRIVLRVLCVYAYGALLRLLLCLGLLLHRLRLLHLRLLYASLLLHSRLLLLGRRALLYHLRLRLALYLALCAICGCLAEHLQLALRIYLTYHQRKCHKE